MNKVRVIICSLVVFVSLSNVYAHSIFADRLNSLHKSLEDLKSKLESLSASLTLLTDKFSKKTQKIDSIKNLITVLNDVEVKKNKKELYSLEFIEGCDELLSKEFVVLSKTVSVITLLKNMVHEIFSGKQISWYGGMGDRIILIFRILDDALRVFSDQKDQPFTHVEYGESGCLQSYILAYGLLKVGFSNVVVHTVSKVAPIDTTKIMLDELNKLEIIKSGQAKINAIAFDRIDYLKQSSKRWSHQSNTLYQTIKCGSFAMVSPGWSLGEKFEDSEMATNFIEAIVQTFNIDFYLQNNAINNPWGPRIYIMMDNGSGGQFELNCDGSDDYAHSISLYKEFGEDFSLSFKKVTLNQDGRKRFRLLNIEPFKPIFGIVFK